MDYLYLLTPIKQAKHIMSNIIGFPVAFDVMLSDIYKIIGEGLKDIID